ncbi:putative DNA repair protein [Talaromyces proteolyticus]|uniref:Topoisomerase 1-associated factor 1 n=1 Tax=Talaromyces proteolyticus TaxID=1131652 RepID=A0AAD4KL74_9EURO|nr:putative DNA repair protein [Talaromyces proteolyticus]KAH8690943.1 putative DNA repair protein [Talaromyces proteolyticus]
MDVDAAPVGRDVQVVDPEVRAHVYSLVTALGGFNGEDASKYCLGDDALACLRDIRKWLKLYDDKTNRLDVARCLAEANLVNGDLLPILTLCRETTGSKKKHLARIALACLELLVPLTWPVEIHSQMTVNHHRHTPYLQQAQVQYKRGILDRQAGSHVLRSVIQIALPSLALPKSERTNRDDGILKLMLYLCRNVAMISPLRGLAAEGDEEETSRSATINAFQTQDVFALLLTMSSNMGDDFNFQDVIILEILFHLVKGVDVHKLFMDDAQRSDKYKEELNDLLRKETGVSREYAKTAPTRHARFGTMIWVKRDDAKVSTVSGQDVLKNGQAAFNKMDQTKKWNRPKHVGRKREVEAASGDFNATTHLTSAATKNLRTFVEEFLDTGFNPLFTHVRKAIEREANRVLDVNTRQFLYLVSWFLLAERVRRSSQRKRHEKDKGTSREIEPDSFSLVAGVLNQETFIFLNRAMQYSFDHGDWQDLNANLRCFSQILLTVQEMAASPLEDDQEIAENIQNRIFYEETTHDRIISIVRGYKDQGFGYLDACTELLHVFVKMLENYSKENTDMQIRSKRRAKRAKKDSSENKKTENAERNESEEEELLDAARVSKERKFDFKRFASRFCNQKSIDAFMQFTTFYRELDDEQLKRAHRFFYRVAFKQDMSILLMRVDILNLFYRMIKGPGALDNAKPIYREWEELIKQLTRKMTKKLDQRPALITEMLFSKINSTLYFLEYGHEKQTVSAGATRAPAELEINPRVGISRDLHLSIVVAALVLDGRADLVKGISETLRSAAAERSTWEAEYETGLLGIPDVDLPPNPTPIDVKASDDSMRTAMYRNGRLRLLMRLVGLERLGTEDIMGAPWIVPSALTSKELEEVKSIIDKCLENPATEFDGQDPRDQIRRIPTAEPKEMQHQSTLDVHFEQLKKNRRKRRRDEDKEPLDDETLEERRRNREENARERQAKIKSDLFVHDSDDESDEDADRDFFEREEMTRKAQDQRIRAALVSKALEEDAVAEKQKGKRATNRRAFRLDDNDDEEENEDEIIEVRKKPRATRGGFEMDEPADDNDDDEDVLMSGVAETNASTTWQGHAENETPPTSAEDEWDLDKELDLHKDLEHPTTAAGDSHSEDEAPVQGTRRRRTGFVLDSDSE